MKRIVLVLWICSLGRPSLAASTAESTLGALPPAVGSVFAQLRQAIAAGGMTATSGVPTATRFRPSGTHPEVEALLARLAGTEEQRQSLREAVETVFKGYEAEAARAHAEYDVAGALVFFVMTHYTLYRDGQEPPDEVIVPLLAQLRSWLNTPTMQQASDAKKQQIYEALVTVAALNGSSQQLAMQQNDTAWRRALRDVGGEGLRLALGVAPDSVELGSNGLRLAEPPAAAPPPEAPPTGLGGLSYRVPDGWAEEKDGGTVTISRVEDNGFGGRRSCFLILGAGVQPRERLNDTYQASWQAVILPSMDGVQRPFVMRRRLGDGIACAFANADMKVKANDAQLAVTHYVLDAGTAAPTITMLVSGDTADFLPRVEAFFADLRLPSASARRPLAAPADLVGSWTVSSISLADYISPSGAYAGDASIATGETLELRADGSYSSSFVGIVNGRTIREKQSGSFALDGEFLVFTPGGEAPVSRRRFLGVGPTPDGQGTVLLLMSPDYDLRPANIRFYGEWFRRRAPE